MADDGTEGKSSIAIREGCTQNTQETPLKCERNISQIKEQDKTKARDLSEMETIHLLDREFIVMI